MPLTDAEIVREARDCADNELTALSTSAESDDAFARYVIRLTEARAQAKQKEQTMQFAPGQLVIGNDGKLLTIVGVAPNGSIQYGGYFVRHANDSADVYPASWLRAATFADVAPRETAVPVVSEAERVVMQLRHPLSDNYNGEATNLPAATAVIEAALQRREAAAISAEREACAKIADAWHNDDLCREIRARGDAK